MDTVRIATVGAGNLSTAKIYPCFQALPVELVAVCDLDRDKAEDRARRFGAGKVYTDIDEMLAREELDALVGCIGPEAHPIVAKKGLAAGLHVYTEKPPSVTSAEALEVAKLAAKADRLVMAAFKKRYTPIYVRMKHEMAAEGFAPPKLISMRRSSGQYANDGPRSEFLLDFCIHGIDLMAWLGGTVDEVYATSPNPNAYSVSLQFESGTVGSMALAGASWGYADEQVCAYGAGPGFIESRDMRQLFMAGDGGEMREVYRVDFSTAGQDGQVVGGFFPEMQAFVQAVRTGDRSHCRSDIVQSYRSMVLYEGIKESAASNQPVTLSYDI
ncbi:MAG TPA: Gfo/Idh/MocA family oxidoreductase [Armatimonadota bacterium]|nr:Gfo/Idh/MocA family oxidoreductase [Armatimonadota bacterium]